MGKRNLGVVLCLLSASLVFSGPSVPSYAAAQPAAESWQVVISGHSASPPYKVVVDKSRQQLSFFERHSPLKLSRVFFGTTGQAVGDKIVEGDLKTPEGVYFVVHRIGSGLEFRRFGHEAYTLNYPNPVDRLRRKTGHGIWIHGRGEPLTPLQTEGCVAMDNGELAMLGKLLTPGTPVILTESFVFSPEENKEQATTAEELHQKVKDWAAAWSARSAAYFDLYDKQAYGIAQGESFSAFRAHKERLWPSLSWVRTTASDIQVLQGPGYWVTWFYQDYQASNNIKVRGVRRLYWMKDGGGEFKIVGMEWRPGLSTSSTLVASAFLPPLETPVPAVVPDGWIVADAGTPGSYGVLAAAEGRLPARITASASFDVTVASGPLNDVPIQVADAATAAAAPVPEALPVATSATDADVALPVAERGAGSEAAASAALARPSQEAVLLAEADRLRQSMVTQAAAVAPQVAAAPVVLKAAPDDEELASQVVTAVQAWRAAWEQGDLEAYMAHYAPRAKQGARRNTDAIRKQKEELWSRAKPASVLLEDMRVNVKNDTAQVVMRQKYADEKGNGDIGRKTLALTLRDGAWLITQEDWSALPHEISN